jgi:5S rRNA maturation endonuclease (ribonuclease M5)
LASILPLLNKDDFYYARRGVSKAMIDRYHISFCNDPNRPFYQRVFVPVLDPQGKYVIGYTGRSIFEKCEQCGLYHDPDWKDCPTGDTRRYAKWKHSLGFRSEHCLYNLWHARRFIEETGVAILVEGPADVWAYEEAGIHNSVGIFGVYLSNQQRVLLQKAGALTLVITLDNDESGIAARKRLEEELEHYFRLYFVVPNGEDIGSMDAIEINEQIQPVLAGASRVVLSSGHYTS